MTSSEFDIDLAITPLPAGEDGTFHFEAAFHRRWWIVVGPNGGVMAALVARTGHAAVAQLIGPGEPERRLRTMSIHYLAPPAEGPARFEVRITRLARTFAFATVTVRQGDRLLAVALTAFSGPRDALAEWSDRTPPAVPGPDGGATVAEATDAEVQSPLRDRYEYRWVAGVPGLAGGLNTDPLGPDAEHLVGGWIRLRQPRPVDHAVLAAISDAWMPAMFANGITGMAPPTVELTLHVRTDPVELGLADDAWVLALFRQSISREGFLDETGEIWSADGHLLADVRQMGALVPAPDAGRRRLTFDLPT